MGTGIIYRKVNEQERAQILSVQDTQPGVRAKGDWLRRSSRTVQLPKHPFTSVTPESNITISNATPGIAVSALKRKSSPSHQILGHPVLSDLVSSEELSLPTPPSTSGFRDGEAESSWKRIKLSSDDDDGKDSAVEGVHDGDFSPGSIKVGATSSSVPLAQSKKKRQTRKPAVSVVPIQPVVLRRPRPYGQPTVWAEVCFIAVGQYFLPTKCMYRGVKIFAKRFPGSGHIRAEHIPLTVDRLDFCSTKIADYGPTSMGR